MNIEYETKVLDIDAVTIVSKLRDLHAEEQSEIVMRRYVYDYDSPDTEFLRLRDAHGKATLTYKRKRSNSVEIGKTIEIEVVVSDFDATAAILNKLVFKRTFYQENKRHIFKLNGIEFSIDTWPMLKPFLEVEALNKEKLDEGLKILNLQGKDVGDKDMKSIYQDRGIDIHSYKELRF